MAKFKPLIDFEKIFDHPTPMPFVILLGSLAPIIFVMIAFCPYLLIIFFVILLFSGFRYLYDNEFINNPFNFKEEE